MKLKFLFAFMIGGFAVASAQGFKDGIQYYRADQPEEAEIIINRTIDDPSTDKAEAYYYLGQIAFQNKNLSAAKQNFEKGIAANPNNAFNYVGLGQLALNEGNTSLAEDNFKKAKGLAKKNAIVLTDIARAYWTADPVKYDKEVKKYIAEARKADKNCPAIFILEADILASTDKIGDAAGYYEMAMSAPNGVEYPEAFVKYARTYFRVNPQYAINGLIKLLDIAPNSALAQRELAEKYYDNDQLTRAAEQYGKYIQNPNHFKRDEQRYVGLLYYGKKYNESNDLAAKILSEDPDNIYMKRMRLLNFAALGDLAAATKAGEDFFNTPGDKVANDYVTYANVLADSGRTGEAVALFEKAVAMAPEKTSLLKDLSSIYTEAEMFDKAAEAQQKFIDTGDYSTNDLMILARRYQNAAASLPVDDPARAGFADKAVETINKVYELVPDNYQVLLTRGRILLIANNNEPNAQVVDALKQVLNKLDEDPANLESRKNDYIFIYNQLGKYYLDQKDNATAKMYYTKFLDIDPTNEPLRQFIDKIK